MTETVFESGYERDRLGSSRGRLDIRWWFYLCVPGAQLRNQRVRQGVIDRGFRFARGGRAASPTDAEESLRQAYEEAKREAGYWRGQPTHQLGSRGELIPLDEVLPELTR